MRGGSEIEGRLIRVNHVTGRGPRWTEQPGRHFAASFDANGLLPLGLPQLAHAPDGTSAWTVRRVFYQLNSGEELAAGGVERMIEASAQTNDEARELIRQAVLVSVRQRNWFGRLVS